MHLTKLSHQTGTRGSMVDTKIYSKSPYEKRKSNKNTKSRIKHKIKSLSIMQTVVNNASAYDIAYKQFLHQPIVYLIELLIIIIRSMHSRHMYIQCVGRTQQINRDGVHTT